VVLWCLLAAFPTAALILAPWSVILGSWETTFMFVFFGLVVVVWTVGVVRIFITVRREDADVARWERARAAAPPDADRDAMRRWPNVLLGFDWEVKIDDLDDAWSGSRLASPEAEPNYLTLKTVIA
jgi:hypothetical protein